MVALRRSSSGKADSRRICWFCRWKVTEEETSCELKKKEKKRKRRRKKTLKKLIETSHPLQPLELRRGPLGVEGSVLRERLDEQAGGSFLEREGKSGS